MSGSSFKSLAAGESYMGTCNVTWTATAGVHYFLVIADDVNRFPEMYEDNNQKTKKFIIAE
jgi:subtilase family serine protease